MIMIIQFFIGKSVSNWIRKFYLLYRKVFILINTFLYRAKSISGRIQKIIHKHAYIVAIWYGYLQCRELVEINTLERSDMHTYIAEIWYAFTQCIDLMCIHILLRSDIHTKYTSEEIVIPKIQKTGRE